MAHVAEWLPAVRRAAPAVRRLTAGAPRGPGPTAGAPAGTSGAGDASPPAGGNGRVAVRAGDGQRQELADAVRVLERVAELAVEGDPEKWVASTDPGALDVAVGDEVGDDRLGRPLGDAHPGGDVTTADLRVGGDADEDVAVVGEERPTLPAGRGAQPCPSPHPYAFREDGEHVLEIIR